MRFYEMLEQFSDGADHPVQAVDTGNILRHSFPAGLLRTFVGRIVSHLPSLSPYGIEDNIRKYAHIAEFLLLSAAFFLLSLAVFRRRKPAFHLMVSLLLSAAAALDEWHQTFVPGRNGTPGDVLIDALGFVPGALICFLLCLLVRRGKRKKEEEAGSCD